MKKTKYMVFKGKNVKHDIDDLHIKFNNCFLTRVQTIKFLGINIDESFCWKSHVSYISSKIASVLGILYTVNKVLPQNILLDIYNTLILPHLSYAILVWGSCSMTLKIVYQFCKKKLFVQ